MIFDGGRFIPSQGAPIALNSIFGYVVADKLSDTYTLPAEFSFSGFYGVSARSYSLDNAHINVLKLVVILFKDDPSLLGEFLSIASSSLDSLDRRFKRDPNLFRSYEGYFF